MSKVRVRECGSEEFREGVAVLRSKVYAHQYEDYPEAFDINWHVAMWKWAETHPLGDGVHRWILDDGEQVVGFLGAVPQHYRIGGERVVAHTPADYMVLPGYGFHALSLMRRFFRETENCVACDQVQAAIEVETRMGARESGELLYAAKLLDLSRLPRLPRGVPKFPLKALTAGIKASDAVLGRVFGEKLEVEDLDGFDESFDALFEKVAATVSCIPEKDAAFLRWRYGPGSPQAPVELIGVRDGRELLGYAVLRVTMEGDNGYVLDLMTLPGRRDVARALLREAVRRFTRSGVYIARYRYLESPASPGMRDLNKLGFFFRKQRRHRLLVKFADRGLHKIALDAGGWSYNIGDGEAAFWVR